VVKDKKRGKRRSRLAVPFRRREKRETRVPGIPPGSLVPIPNPSPSRITVFSYGDENCDERELKNIDEIKEWRGKNPVTWVNIDGIDDVELIRKMGEMFGLHPLALEDCIHTTQRPKVDEYDNHLFIIIRMPEILHGTDLDLEQVSLFLGKDFVITVQEKPGDCLGIIRDRIRSHRGRIRKWGPDYLAYALIDATVDYYFPILDSYGDRIQAAERALLEGSGRQVLNDVYIVRQDLTRLRRSLWPLRDALNNMMKGEYDFFVDDTRVFLRDCFDHTAHHIDQLDGLREMVTSLMDLHMSSLSQRMNEIMKMMTLITTVFIPMSFIAGVYGMNFDRAFPWNMPELGWAHGYLFSLALMAVVGLGFLWFFWSKGWFTDHHKRD
jgi:magnesium transporter